MAEYNAYDSRQAIETENEAAHQRNHKTCNLHSVRLVHLTIPPCFQNRVFVKRAPHCTSLHLSVMLPFCSRSPQKSRANRAHFPCTMCKLRTFWRESTNILCTWRKKLANSVLRDVFAASVKHFIFPIASFRKFPYNRTITLERTMLWISMSCSSCRSCGKVQHPG